MAWWGQGTVGDVAWSPDGSRLIVATPLGIFLYDAETIERVAFIETDTDLREIALSPDGEVLALAGEGTRQLWSISDGSLTGPSSRTWEDMKPA